MTTPPISDGRQVPRVNFSAASLPAAPRVTVSPRTYSAPPPEPAAQRGSFLVAFAGWAFWLMTVYCVDHARPVSRKIDRFFGGSSRREWDETFLFIGLGLGFLALMMAAVSAVLAFAGTRGAHWRPPVSAGVLAVFSIGVLIYTATNL